jgi:glycosyltransferase involved in cell wall biosynthesis
MLKRKMRRPRIERRILIVLRSLDVGGSQRQALHLARELRRAHGAVVAVWTLEKGGVLSRELQEADIPWENHAAIMGASGPGKILPLAALIRSMRRWRPDAIIPFNDLPNKVCNAVWKFTGGRTCFWNQRDEGREVTGRFLERRAVRRAGVFAANSAEGAEFLARTFGIAPERIHLIPNGVQLEPARQEKEDWRARLQAPARSLLVSMVAHLHRFKDHETLLRAWAILQKEKADVDMRLVLAGRKEGTHARLLQLSRDLDVGNSVLFPGFTDDVSGLLAASDIGVFSSRCEGMPNGVLEYMAAGLPVAATRIAGITEALGVDYPLLVPAADARALADALLALVRDEDLRRSLGQRNRLRARELFSVAAMAERYAAILERCLEGGGAGR